MFTTENEIFRSCWRQVIRLKRIGWLSETDLVSQSNLKKKLTTGQCSQLEVAYQESIVKISKDKFDNGGDHGKVFYDWGEEFVISFDFEASYYPPGLTNILHIYDYGLVDEHYLYDTDDPLDLDDYGRAIPGFKTF